MSKGAAYLVIISQDFDLVACGEMIPTTFKRPLNAGVNFVGYMGDTPEAADDYLAGLLVPAGGGVVPLIVAQTFGNGVPGAQNYVPGAGNGNSLREFIPNQGYRVIVNQMVNNYRGVSGNTESFEFLYGDIRGAAYLAGEPVEVLNANGEVIQTITPDANGHFYATPIFGEVFRVDGSYAAGLENGESISFRYRGEVLDLGTAFGGRNQVNEVTLEFNGTTTSTDLELNEAMRLSVTPNPVGDRATITLENTTVRPVKVLLMDANGRVVKQVLTTDALAVGTTRLEWSEASDLAPGLYSLIVLSEGRLLDELTQRVVKQ